MTDTTQSFPAPWSLRGRGTILLYRFDSDFIATHGNVPEWLLPQYRGGLGAVMLVDYTQSPVGPYQELLFIPGQFQFGRRRYYHITRIYVSSQVSVDNGQENWGIPKQLADFEVEKVDERTKRWTVWREGQPILQAQVRAGLLRLPVNTVMNPLPARLLQRRERDGAFLSVEPYGGGTIGLAPEIQTLEAHGGRFPDITEQSPLGALEVVSFRLTFPVPREEP